MIALRNSKAIVTRYRTMNGPQINHLCSHLCTEEAESLYPGLPVKHICNFLGSPMRKAMAQWRGDPSPRRPHHRSRLDPEYIRFLQETSNLDYEVGLIQRCLSIDQVGRAGVLAKIQSSY